MVDRDPDVVQGDAGVEEALDDLEDEDVLERVQPLTSRPGRAADRRAVESLIALQLAAMTSDGPVITRKGRSVLLRGSPQLWDVAA